MASGARAEEHCPEEEDLQGQDWPAAACACVDAPTNGMGLERYESLDGHEAECIGFASREWIKWDRTMTGLKHKLVEMNSPLALGSKRSAVTEGVHQKGLPDAHAAIQVDASRHILPAVGSRCTMQG